MFGAIVLRRAVKFTQIFVKEKRARNYIEYKIIIVIKFGQFSTFLQNLPQTGRFICKV